MEYTEAHTEHFLCLQEMTDVGAGIAAASCAVRTHHAGADRTLTALLDRTVIHLILKIKEVHLTLVGIDMTMAAVSRRVNAVKEIDTAVNALDDVCRCADAHKIGRLFLRKMRYDDIEDMIHLLMCLTDRESADGIAIEIHLRNRIGVLYPDVFEDAALVDAEEKLVRIYRIRQTVQPCHLCLTALEPAGRPLDRRENIAPVCKRRRAFVKGHSNRRAQVRLNLHRFLRSHENHAAIDMGMERNAFFFDLSTRTGKAENLKSTGIGQNGTIPLHELVKPTHFFDELIAGPYMQVIGI